MIISASRRTDIPALYSQWFMNRVRAGYCLVPNPRNLNQLSYVSLRPEDVDVIVFWSKNPAPIVNYLGELNSRGLRYYFQFAVNDYPRLLEPSMPGLDQRIHTFRRISNQLGPARVVWRYDPIIISNRTPPSFHIDKFSKIAEALTGSTRRVMVSFVDFYQKTDRNLSALECKDFLLDREAVHSQRVWDLLEDLSAIAKCSEMDILTCAEKRDYSNAGVPPGPCIDGELLARLWSLHGHTKKDPSQRAACLCVVSKDIGMNDTCIHGCAYCYSTQNLARARRRHNEHDPESPVLWGESRDLSEAEKAHQARANLL